MISLFKVKEKISERLPGFYEEGEQSTTVEIFCNKDQLWREHVIYSEFSSHHFTKYNCSCGATLKLAVIEYAYMSDRKHADKNHIVASKTGFKPVLDHIDLGWVCLG